MSKTLKLRQMLGLIVAVFFLQACTCWGIDIGQFFTSRSQASEPENVELVQTGMNCENLRLTSPLNGLPNGMATFYWDSLEGATAYRINLYGDGVYLTGFDATGDATNLSADVSWNAIGGQYSILVELIAEDANANQCSETVLLSREAPNDPNPNPPAPSATPTCAENPSAPYC